MLSGSVGVPVIGRTRALRALLERDQLLRGSVNLAVSNFSATGLGFVGWVLTTRLFDVGEVGEAAAMIATASLIANVAFLGVPGTLLRFLPGSADRAQLVRTAVSVTSLTGLVIALAVAVVQVYSAHAQAMAVAMAGIFVVLVVTLVLKAVMEAATIAVRASQVALKATVAGNIAKIGALSVLGWLAAGPQGILAAQLILVLVNLVGLSGYLRSTGWLRGGIALDRRIIRRLAGYSGSYYINGLVGGLPLLLLPSLVKSNLGADAAGYWYVASLIATSMSLMSSAVGQSLLVEASHSTVEVRPLAWRALRGLTMISAPLVLVAVVAAPWLLAVFGAGYATESLPAFRVLALSTLLSPTIYVLGTVYFIRRRIAPPLVANAVNALVVLVLSNQATSIVGVAWAWTLGEFVYIGMFLAMLPFFRPRGAIVGV